MEYRAYPPPPDLSPWVECAWTLYSSLPNPHPGPLILPDGRLECIFHLASPPSGQPPAMLAGRMLHGLPLPAHTALHSLGLRLRPGAAHAFLPCHEIGPVESLLDLLGTWAQQALERLANSPQPVSTLWALLRARAPRFAPPDLAIQHSVAAIQAARGRGPLDAFLPSGLQTRQWQRRFLLSTGFTPKAFARILRLQHTIALATTTPTRSLTTLALDAGFYDQAHLTNEFRAFTGLPPAAFFASQFALTDFYLDAFFQDPPRTSR